eukprot:m.179594 g.179594  ORF g.179594 m.179594 type:complete len:269 (+) comp13570_c0_seq3:224-1030(+)
MQIDFVSGMSASNEVITFSVVFFVVGLVLVLLVFISVQRWQRRRAFKAAASLSAAYDFNFVEKLELPLSRQEDGSPVSITPMSSSPSSPSDVESDAALYFSFSQVDYSHADSGSEYYSGSGSEEEEEEEKEASDAVTVPNSGSMVNCHEESRKEPLLPPPDCSVVIPKALLLHLAEFSSTVGEKYDISSTNIYENITGNGQIANTAEEDENKEWLQTSTSSDGGFIDDDYADMQPSSNMTFYPHRTFSGVYNPPLQNGSAISVSNSTC